MNNNVPTKEYTFKLTLQEATNVVTALKKFPMDEVENLVRKLDAQYIAEAKADAEALAKNQEAQNPGPNSEEVTKEKKPRKSKAA